MIDIEGYLKVSVELTIYNKVFRNGSPGSGNDRIRIICIHLFTLHVSVYQLMKSLPFALHTGGLPAKAGDVQIISLARNVDYDKLNNYFTIIKEDGQAGANGAQASCEYEHLQFAHEFASAYSCVAKYTLQSTSSRNCASASTSINSYGQKKPAAPVHLDKVPSLIAYKTFIRENLNDKNRVENLIEVHSAIGQNDFDTRALAKELDSYEMHFFKLKGRVNFKPIYKDILNRIIRYSRTHNNIIEPEERKILLCFYTAILSKLFSLKAEREQVLVVDVINYFPIIRRNIENFNNLGAAQVINNYKKVYRDEMDMQIIEAQGFIEGLLLPAIADYLHAFEDELDDLLKEVQEKKNEAKEYKECQERLSQSLQMKTMFDTLAVVGQAVSFFMPAAGLAVGVASSLAGSFISVPNGSQNVRPATPEGAKNLVRRANQVVYSNKNRKITALSREITKLEANINKPEFQGVREPLGSKLKLLKQNLQNAQNSPNADCKSIDAMTRDFNTQLMQQHQQLKKANAMGAASILGSASNSLTVISTVVDVYDTYKDNQFNIDQCSESIKEAQMDQEMYQEYEKRIYDTLRPMIKDAGENLMNMTDDLNGESRASLDIERWNIQTYLREIKNDLISFVDGFKVEDNIVNIMDNLKDSFDQLINIYDRIQSYTDQQQLSDFIANVNSPEFSLISINDPELNSALRNLQLTTSAGIILAQHNRVLNAVKQTVFPFANFYFRDYDLPNSLKVEHDTTDLIKTLVAQLGDLEDRIKSTNQTGTNVNDQSIHTGLFRSNEVLRPFYIWRRSDYGRNINALLSGKRVYFLADVAKSSHLNAVKFNVVEIEFFSKNPQATRQIRSALNAYTVSMKHTGTSYYRCDKHFYKINAASQTMNYGFKKKNGRPTTKNAVYEKLENGNIVLSPYTLWSIQLKRKDGNFTSLARFKGLVDMQLIGRGQYVEPNAAVCKSGLERYYQLAD